MPGPPRMSRVENGRRHRAEAEASCVGEVDHVIDVAAESRPRRWVVSRIGDELRRTRESVPRPGSAPEVRLDVQEASQPHGRASPVCIGDEAR